MFLKVLFFPLDLFDKIQFLSILRIQGRYLVLLTLHFFLGSSSVFLGVVQIFLGLRKYCVDLGELAQSIIPFLLNCVLFPLNSCLCLQNRCLFFFNRSLFLCHFCLLALQLFNVYLPFRLRFFEIFHLCLQFAAILFQTLDVRFHFSERVLLLLLFVLQSLYLRLTVRCLLLERRNLLIGLLQLLQGPLVLLKCFLPLCLHLFQLAFQFLLDACGLLLLFLELLLEAGLLFSGHILVLDEGVDLLLKLLLLGLRFQHSSLKILTLLVRDA